MLCFCAIVVGFVFNDCSIIYYMNWDDISFIYRGKHRIKILELLKILRTPTQLKKETNLHFNVVSRTIIELEKGSFIACLNPKQKLGRFYQITQKGKEVLKKLGQ